MEIAFFPLLESEGKGPERCPPFKEDTRNLIVIIRFLIDFETRKDQVASRIFA